MPCHHSREEHVANILMIAFHYPPFSGSSGILRTLKFSCHLPNHGWQPIILTANRRAYPRTEDDHLREIPMDIPIKRAFALDTSRHLAIRGTYARWMALPDPWVTWWLGAVPAGLCLLRQYRPKIIWSTYPIATAHLIGLTLRRLTSIPWIADFRDSMTDNDYPRDALTRRSYRWIEKQVIRYGSRLVFTAESTRQMYLKRYPALCPERCVLIPNGYDEKDFKDLIFSKPTKKIDDRPTRLLHTGLIYPEDRDPRPFFRALSRLKRAGLVNARGLRIDLRASGSESYYSRIIEELGIDDLVHLLPALPYRQALQDCADADALLLFQAASCNHQIPAKAYEYLRIQRPILALTSEDGDTAMLLRENSGATIIDLLDEQALFLAVPHFLRSVRKGMHPVPESQKIQCYARENQARALAGYLSQLISLDGTK